MFWKAGALALASSSLTLRVRELSLEVKAGMSITKDEARELLQASSLRVTAPRLTVLRVLADAENPLSYTEVLESLGETDWSSTTIYRNLVKLRDAGLATVASRAEGIDRYALARAEDGDHCHPHFVCGTCSRVACLPAEVGASIAISGPWSASIQRATLQLRGECPDCL